MAFCLIPEKVQEFKKALKEKEIDIQKLVNMSSAERSKLFEKYAGENASDVNLLFEKKLVLKNKMLGLQNFFGKLTDSGRYSPEKVADMKKKAEDWKKTQEERILSPKEQEAFLNDLANDVNDVTVSREEAGQIFDLSRKADDYKKEFDGENWKNEDDRLAYGAAKVQLDNYIAALKGENVSVKEKLKGRMEEFKAQKEEVGTTKAIVDLGYDTIKAISDNAISLAASLDNSFMGRQGLKTLTSGNPGIWWNEMVTKSFKDIKDTMGGKDTMNALMADVYSRPDYINGEYQRAGIVDKAVEEAYPSSLAERLPFLGKAFTASEVAFKGSAMRGRMALYDTFKKNATENGVEWTPAQTESFGRLVNSMTAKGKWGKAGESKIVKMVLWSPRMLKANIDFLTAHQFQGITKEAKSQAVKNLVSTIASTALLMTISKAMDKDSVELDPRSSDFGKLKFGDTRFDITGGASSIITLASRLMPYVGGTKSTSSGIISKPGEGYNAKNRFDYIMDFLSNKTSPAAGAVVDILKGENFKGEKTTPLSVLSRGVPIPLKNAYEAMQDPTGTALLGVLTDFFGIGSNTYKQGTDWGLSEGKELLQFKKKVGPTSFEKANEDFNNKVEAKIKELRASDAWDKLSEEDKKKKLTSEKEKIKSAIFKRYNFKYKQEDTDTKKKKNF
jgi:hypothetical protein